MATEQASKRSVSDEDLQKCYDAFTRRRLIRGERSIRTPEGFQRLHRRYQQSVRVAENNKPVSEPAASKDDEAEDVGCLRNVLNVFFNPKIVQVITETCWRLAHFGGGTLNDERDYAGLELDEEKYSTFSLRLIQWVIPELPRRQVQELVQYDWELDRKFDELGREGLSLQGFKLSLLDLLISCTDGTVAKCLEFLNLMARWLQHSLPPYIIQDTTPQADEDFVTSDDLKQPSTASIVWSTVPFSVMTPCQIGEQGLYCELKTKVCSAPIVIMILAADENPIELVLAPSSKLLLSKTGSHKDVHSKFPLTRQGCWTFCMRSKTPSILLVPGSTISRQTKALYACFHTAQHSLESRIEPVESDNNNKITQPAVDGNEEHSEAQYAASVPVSSPLTLTTSVPEPSSLRIGKNKLYYRMERMSSRIFTVERSEQLGEAFSIILTVSLLQNNNTADPVSSTFEATSTFCVCDDYSQDCDIDAHTFIFILKSPVLRKNRLKQDQAVQPRQWFTSLKAANETKTIIVESSVKSPSADANGDVKNGEKVKETQRREIYQLFVFTLHGVHIEVACNAEVPERKREESDPETQETEPDSPNMASEVTSSRLLKELLQLQRMRQLEKTSEPLPDMVLGMQICTTKPVTTAESLRRKILRSREDERYARYLQLEAAIQKRFHARKTSRKTTAAQQSDHSNLSVETPESPISELEKCVNQLTTFFHEMAVHQPQGDELHGSAVEVAEAVAEEQLLKRFSEMFDHDADLQNALDEEKWSTDPVKIARRRDSIHTNLPKMLPTGTRDESRDKCMWTFEDYENTAQYIEQLMLDVASHTTQQQAQQNREDEERKRAVMTQLVDSWQYTQHRVCKTATRKRINEMEQKRRSQWLQSQYIQAKRGDKPERPALILPKQRFLVQEHSLPSNAIWEVPGTPSSQTVLSSRPVRLVRPLSPHTESVLKPQRPPLRPATVSTVERPSNSTALRSAAISRARVRRIRSAHSTTRGGPTPSRTQVVSDQEEMPPQQEMPAFCTPKSNVGVLDDSERSKDSALTKPLVSPRFIGDAVQFEAPLSTFSAGKDRRVDSDTKGTTTERSPEKDKRRREKKKRSRTPSDIHFRRRVLELVSNSAQLQAVAGEEWKEAQGIENVGELSSMSCLPTK
ncbi:hypothetical protein PC121_g10561 [Phytophthora cactorum]|nr:hypothetical protein PC120_g9074 [Phytophthora cactorum]KAG3067395.1 hypothetical protein PC121_g10561 [Phytophthora cactorum]